MDEFSLRTVLITDGYENEFPIKIVLSIYGKRNRFKTGFKIPEKHWDEDKEKVKSSYPEHTVINNIISTRIADLRKKVFELQVAGVKVSKATLLGKTVNSGVVDYFEKLIEQLKGKYQPGTIRNYKVELGRLKKFSPDVKFEDVDHQFLRRYEQHLTRIDGREEGEGLSNNTIHKCWKILRKVFNSARKDKITDNYPFDNYDNPKYKQTERTYLTLKEIDKIESDILKKPVDRSIVIAATYFLLGCYSGLRFSDWQRYNYEGFIKGNRMILRTKKNGKLVSMKIHPRLSSVIDRLKEMPSVFSEQKTNQYLKGLMEITGIKHITTHVARHSFAVMCAEMGVSLDTTAERMGITKRTCEIYYKITNKKMDKEMEVWEQL